MAATAETATTRSDLGGLRRPDRGRAAGRRQPEVDAVRHRDRRVRGRDGLRHRAGRHRGAARGGRPRPVRLPDHRGRRPTWRAPAPAGTPPVRLGRCRRRGSRPLADVVAGLQAAIEHFTPPGQRRRPAHPGVHAVPRRPGLPGPGADRGADGRARRPADLRPRRHRPGVRAAAAGLLVHVNPHNPLGRVFTVEEQLALADVVDGRRGPGVLRRDPRAAGVSRAPCTGPTRPCPPPPPGTRSPRRRRPRRGTCPASRRPS